VAEAIATAEAAAALRAPEMPAGPDEPKEVRIRYPNGQYAPPLDIIKPEMDDETTPTASDAAPLLDPAAVEAPVAIVAPANVAAPVVLANPQALAEEGRPVVDEQGATKPVPAQDPVGAASEQSVSQSGTAPVSEPVSVTEPAALAAVTEPVAIATPVAESAAVTEPVKESEASEVVNQVAAAAEEPESAEGGILAAPRLAEFHARLSALREKVARLEMLAFGAVQEGAAQ